MKTVAIISQKGGSGKTTIAVHLAVCAERAKKRIAIIDLDPQGSALEWFNRREAETPEVVRAVPEQLAALLAQAKATGINYLVLQLAFGSLGHNNEMRSLELFSREVKPALEALG